MFISLTDIENGDTVILNIAHIRFACPGAGKKPSTMVSVGDQMFQVTESVGEVHYLIREVLAKTHPFGSLPPSD